MLGSLDLMLHNCLPMHGSFFTTDFWLDVLYVLVLIATIAIVFGWDRFSRIISSYRATVPSSKPLKVITLLPAMSFCGLASGLLTTYLLQPGIGELPGEIGMFSFGFALALCLVFFGKLRLWWLPVFSLASYVAFVVSIRSAIITELCFPAVGKAVPQNVSFADSFGPLRFSICGFIGALFMFGMALRPFVLRGISRARTATLGLIWGIGGGVLGVIASLSGPKLGSALCSLMDPPGGCIHSMLGHPYALFPVWQTGMAFVLACLLIANERIHPKPTTSAKPSLVEAL